GVGDASRGRRGPGAGLPPRHSRLPLRPGFHRTGRRARRVRPGLHPRRPLPDHAPAALQRVEGQGVQFMKILVMVKQVPDTATQVKVGSDPRTIDTTGVTWIVSPYDEYAVEEALRIREKRGQVAELLGWPCASWIMEEAVDEAGKAVRVGRQVEGGLEVFDLPLPAVVSAQKGLNEPRYPTLKGIMGAKKKEIKDVKAADLGL